MSKVASAEIAIVNQSSVLSDTDGLAMLPALQHLFNLYVNGPEIAGRSGLGWNLWARLHWVSSVGDIALPPDYWPIYVSDESNIPDAAGYHTRTADGRPIGYAFVGAAQAAGIPSSVLIGHEAGEMRADPYVSEAIQVASRTFAAKEPFDPTELDWFDGPDGVRLPNFVLPSWFNGGAGPYDYLGLIRAPGELRPGGYIGEWHPGRGWTERMFPLHVPARAMLPGTRRARRLQQAERPTANSHWPE